MPYVPVENPQKRGVKAKELSVEKKREILLLKKQGVHHQDIVKQTGVSVFYITKLLADFWANVEIDDYLEKKSE